MSDHHHQVMSSITQEMQALVPELRAAGKSKEAWALTFSLIMMSKAKTDAQRHAALLTEMAKTEKVDAALALTPFCKRLVAAGVPCRTQRESKAAAKVMLAAHAARALDACRGEVFKLYLDAGYMDTRADSSNPFFLLKRFKGKDGVDMAMELSRGNLLERAINSRHAFAIDHLVDAGMSLSSKAQSATIQGLLSIRGLLESAQQRFGAILSPGVSTPAATLLDMLALEMTAHSTNESDTPRLLAWMQSLQMRSTIHANSSSILHAAPSASPQPLSPKPRRPQL